MGYGFDPFYVGPSSYELDTAAMAEEAAHVLGPDYVQGHMEQSIDAREAAIQLQQEAFHRLAPILHEASRAPAASPARRTLEEQARKESGSITQSGPASHPSDAYESLPADAESRSLAAKMSADVAPHFTAYDAQRNRAFGAWVCHLVDKTYKTIDGHERTVTYGYALLETGNYMRIGTHHQYWDSTSQNLRNDVGDAILEGDQLHRIDMNTASTVPQIPSDQARRVIEDIAAEKARRVQEKELARQERERPRKELLEEARVASVLLKHNRIPTNVTFRYGVEAGIGKRMVDKEKGWILARFAPTERTAAGVLLLSESGALVAYDCGDDKASNILVNKSKIALPLSKHFGSTAKDGWWRFNSSTPRIKKQLCERLSGKISDFLDAHDL